MRRFAVILIGLGAAAALVSPAWAAPDLSPWAKLHPKLPRAERKAVARTIAGFVLHAVRHKNAGAAYALVSPTMREGLTRKQFAHQNPVYPFPARGTKFPWTLQYVEPTEIGGTLFLQPRRGAKTGPILFDLRLTKHHGRWLVESLIPAATFGSPTEPRVRSVRDYAPQAAMQGAAATPGKGRISGTYAIIPFAALGALLTGLAGWGLMRRHRDRRIASDSVRARDARARATH
jgi:hypothetical protein